MEDYDSRLDRIATEVNRLLNNDNLPNRNAWIMLLPFVATQSFGFLREELKINNLGHERY